MRLFKENIMLVALKTQSLLILKNGVCKTVGNNSQLGRAPLQNRLVTHMLIIFIHSNST